MAYATTDAILAALAMASLLGIALNFLLAPGLRVLRMVAGARHPPAPGRVEKVSIVVPAYNEERNIGLKIETLQRALRGADFEAEILIGSDGSTDRTAEVARACLAAAGLATGRVLEFRNEGKGSTLNKLFAQATGDVVIATDADIPLPENSVALAVQAFRANNRLGCISCIPWFEGLDIGKQRSYWGLEDRIRRAESDWGRLIVVTGMLSALRRELYRPIPAGVMADDLWIPLNVLLEGWECSQVDALRVPYEKTDEATEVARRRRVMVGGMDVVRRLWRRLASRPTVLLLVLLHKVNRWALPLWALLFAACLALLFPWMLVAYAAFAALGVLVLGAHRFRLLVYTALSPLLSFAEFLKRKDLARWEPTRKS